MCVHVCVFEDDTEYCKDFSLMRSHRIGVCVGGGCVSIDASALMMPVRVCVYVCVCGGGTG